MGKQLLIWLERLLIADVFLVIFGFGWFAIAIVGRSLNLPLGWEIWYRLWQPLFNPAIAILIGGAILNWSIKKIAAQFTTFERKQINK